MNGPDKVAVGFRPHVKSLDSYTDFQNKDL